MRKDLSLRAMNRELSLDDELDAVLETTAPHFRRPELCNFAQGCCERA